MCTVGRPSEESRSVECKFKQMVAAQQKILDSFLEIDSQLDGEEDREERGSTEKKGGRSGAAGAATSSASLQKQPRRT